MKALVVGLGSIGQRHVRNLRLVRGDDLEITVWRSRGIKHVINDDFSVEDGVDPVLRYGCREVPSLEAGLAEAPDWTFVCNPTSGHLQVALDAVRSGSHVFIEKPLSHDEKGVDTLISESSRRKLTGYVGYQLRFHPAIRCLEDLLNLRAIGQVLAVSAAVGEDLSEFHKYEDYRATYAARHDLGGGVVLTQSHEIDYLRHLFGMPSRIFAVGGHVSALEIDVEDIALLAMACGTRERQLPVTLQMNFLQRPAVRGCEVIGEDGKLIVDLLAPSVRQINHNGSEVLRKDWARFRRNDMFVEQLKHFFACCAGTEMPRSSLESGATTLKIALAALRSIKGGRAEEFVR
jgi:predicted dehydrogenase